ncbi:hypothetical protein SADUNF_Sadunf15G0112600 [Salix dunnii]|uniref:Uncharacterized protein n=1 Tax=Salix dunnii TaxID=1413687 RepID=A0A835JF85_9ROSI|nr:hypothetical protein SADUNF_Sadunf15G0112600 [Salix dunnii]
MNSRFLEKFSSLILPWKNFGVVFRSLERDFLTSQQRFMCLILRRWRWSRKVTRYGQMGLEMGQDAVV